MEEKARPNDEFEVYFQKAAAQNLDLERIMLDDPAIARRGSLPNSVRRIQLEEGVSDHIRRASSFRKVSKSKANGSSITGSNYGKANNSSSNVDVPSGSNFLLCPDAGANLTSTSAPQSRSGSFKKMTKPRSIKDFQEMHADFSSTGETRRMSVNLEEMVASKLKELKQLENDNCCVVRSFVTSPKGIVNRGDSFKRKDSKSTKVPSGSHPVGSSSSLKLPNPGGLTAGAPPGVVFHRVMSHDRPNNILIMGDHKVGKTSLVTQFMTSDYLAGLDTSFENDVENEKTISVLVNDVETMLNFIDVDISEQESRPPMRERGISCYVIVYSLTERASFNYAAHLLNIVCPTNDQAGKKHLQRTYAVILVANKGDLVRNRQISESEAKELCTQCRCKYIEISAGLNHRVDDLLVGIVSQVRLNDKREEMKVSSNAEVTQNIKPLSYLGMLKRFFVFRSKDSQDACENLQTL